MSLKRSRSSAFEADLQRAQSPYVFFGTPLLPLDDNVRDDGSYVPVWKQEVVDERGRKRLHGAFTGGFSAGYFNTVGSKEGWTPATFVSSRTNRASKKDADASTQQRAEDFMDEEDLADAEEAKQLETKDKFAGFALTEEDLASRAAGRGGGAMDLLFRPQDETVGLKLLRKMGWRDGEEIGPTYKTAKAKSEKTTDSSKDGSDLALSLPRAITKLISFVRKTDTKGLGYGGAGGLQLGGVGVQSQAQDTEPVKVKKPVIKPRRSGMGIGVLNDTGSDDEDPFDMGPKLSYRSLGGDKKKKKKQVDTAKAASVSSNPLLKNKPLFVSKKASGFRKCHDGRLPPDGFILSTRGPVNEDRKYPPPKIPEGWKSSKASSGIAGGSDGQKNPTNSEYQSTADLAKASTLDPSSRASILGETVLPGKSVFDFLTPAAREKLAAASHNQNLPPARSEAFAAKSATGEAGPSSTPGSSLGKPATEEKEEDQIPPLDPQIASYALNRGTNGFVPYADDPAKLARYRAFLSYRAAAPSLTGDSATSPASVLPPKCPPDTQPEDFIRELHEFAHAATIFKPMTGAMASRFTSSSGVSNKTKKSSRPGHGDGTDDGATEDDDDGDTRNLRPEEQAARAGMWGPLTRITSSFLPSRLLCKRFGVSAPPVSVQMTSSEEFPSTSQHGATVAASTDLSSFASRFTSGGVQLQEDTEKQRRRDKLEILGKRDMDALRLASGLPALGEVVRRKDRGVDSGGGVGGPGAEGRGSQAIDTTRNEALEAPRASEETFRAVFADD